MELAKPDWSVAIDDYIGTKTYVAFEPGSEPVPGIEIQGQVLVRHDRVEAPAGATRYQVAAHAGNNYLVPTELKGQEYRVEEAGGRVYFVTDAGRFPGTLISPEDNRFLGTRIFRTHAWPHVLYHCRGLCL